jgi:hypothetical protein
MIDLHGLTQIPLLSQKVAHCFEFFYSFKLVAKSQVGSESSKR